MCLPHPFVILMHSKSLILASHDQVDDFTVCDLVNFICTIQIAMEIHYSDSDSILLIICVLQCFNVYYSLLASGTQH